MCTFFARCAVLAVLLAGCSRGGAGPRNGGPSPSSRDTLTLRVPVIRLTPADSAYGSVAVDSATLAMLERRIMSRVSSLLRTQAEIVAGRKTDGIPPTKNNAPDIRHGLLGTITFNDDGTLDETSRDRLEAVARLLNEFDGPIEVRAATDLGNANTIDIAIARARRVYLDLIALNRELGERDVAITATGIHTVPMRPQVEIFWQEVVR